MVKIPHIPPSFSFIQKEKLLLLCHEKYKETFFEIEEELKSTLQAMPIHSSYLEGRKAHPVLTLPNGQRVVVRQYVHGGLLRFFTRSLFLFGARSFRELALTEEIRSMGIPTVTPIAAIHQIILYPFYRPYLLTLEIPEALNLIQYFQTLGPKPFGESLLQKRKLIQSVGLLLKKFHQAGFYHGDLQLKNILVSEDQVLIIDLDRSYRKALLSKKERVRNLLRLNRSVEKWKDFGVSITQADRLRFLKTYAKGDIKILEEIRRALRFYPILLFLHRMGWKIQNFFKKMRIGSFRYWT
ncbi:MAG: lipopolysaccharide kinase InaA family protein [Thermodesulfobacteriota bacterium]